MNRRNFIKFLGLGGAAIATPVLAKLPEPDIYSDVAGGELAKNPAMRFEDGEVKFVDNMIVISARKSLHHDPRILHSVTVPFTGTYQVNAQSHLFLNDEPMKRFNRSYDCLGYGSLCYFIHLEANDTIRLENGNTSFSLYKLTTGAYYYDRRLRR